jgi:hypothetical protein
VFEAIHQGRPDSELLAYQYLQTLPKIASGDGNHALLDLLLRGTRATANHTTAPSRGAAAGHGIAIRGPSAGQPPLTRWRPR